MKQNVSYKMYHTKCIIQNHSPILTICEFCFWDMKKTDKDYLSKLQDTMNLNVLLCVLTDGYITTKEDIIKYVQYAKMAGDCPVCRTRIQLIKGIDVHWKTSVLEPSDTLPDVLFETVFNASIVLDPMDIEDSSQSQFTYKFDPEAGEVLTT